MHPTVRNRYRDLEIPRGQCNSPGAADAAERAAAKRQYKREMDQSLEEAIRAELAPHRPRK
jgi:hypothetical protein